MNHFTSVVIGEDPPGSRTVKSVPFVELIGGRIQGVVSSGSDLARVYVSFFEVKTGHYYCCTNNNRPCGGLRGAPCKHIHELIAAAILEFGPNRVASYLGLEGKEVDVEAIATAIRALRGNEVKESPGIVFSRFLSYLRYCELSVEPGLVLEMGWFPS